MALESLLTSAAEGMLIKVASLAAHQDFGMALGFKDELSKLSESFSRIQDISADVSKQAQGLGKAVEEWAKKLKRCS